MTAKYVLHKCENCKNEIPWGNFCIDCGTQITKGGIELERQECDNCKRRVPIGKYCTVCGTIHKTQ